MRGKSKEIQSTPEGAYRFGEFEVYPSERQLHRQNIEAPLPPKAFDALMILVRKAGQLVRKELEGKGFTNKANPAEAKAALVAVAESTRPPEGTILTPGARLPALKLVKPAP